MNDETARPITDEFMKGCVSREACRYPACGTDCQHVRPQAHPTAATSMRAFDAVCYGGDWPDRSAAAPDVHPSEAKGADRAVYEGIAANYRAPAKPACCDTCRFLAGFECRRHAPAAVLVMANPVHHIASWPRIRDSYRESCGEHEPEGARPAP